MTTRASGWAGIKRTKLSRSAIGQPSGRVHATKIDNWFDHKWLNFGSPFAADRIEEDRTYVWCEKRELYDQWSLPVLDECRGNREELLERAFPPLANQYTLFVWVSGNTEANGRGSMLVHDVVGEQRDNWYCSFSRAGVWKLDKCKGTSKTVMDFYRERGREIDLGFGTLGEQFEESV